MPIILIEFGFSTRRFAYMIIHIKQIVYVNGWRKYQFLALKLLNSVYQSFTLA